MVESTIKNISELIKHPEKTSDEDLKNLFELSKKYSYSAVFYIIIANVLKVQKRTGFENFLKSAALRSNNRNQLFNILNSQSIQKEIDDKEEKILSANKTSKTKPENSKNEEEKFLEETIITQLISSELIHEIEQENIPIKSKKQNLKVIDNKTEYTFENWLYKKNSQTISEAERSVDDVLKSLENRKHVKEKTNFFSAESKAKKSLVDKEDMSTETLAEIYVKQGNYPKAIKIYEQLMLSNPEKKLFFASRINYINNKTIL